MLARLVSALAGRYEIERELGRGGMATVYLAHDVRHDRHVAIKVLDPELGSSVGPDRFLREIATAARLTHPNVLTLHDSGDAGGLLYYVMPYVRGESLRRRLDRERQLPIDDALAIARQVASALDYAHFQGVVHRDIKPENILMGEGGQAIVADFGLARVLHDATAGAPLTGTGMAVGTPAYMSPEQASADRAVDPRTDVYSLACVVYEMIAGLPPFRGATVQAIVAHHLSTPAPSLCIDRETCPESIDVAVRRALAKTPADRFRSAGEFVRAMDPDGSLGAGVISYGPQSRRTAPAPRAAVARGTFGMRTLTAVGLLIAVAIGGVTYAALGGPDSSGLDESKLVVMPFSTDGRDTVAAAEAAAFQRHFREALAEWEGLNIVPATETALAAGEDRDRAAGALDVARRLGAGRLVRGTIQALGDSILVSATSYDVRDGKDRATRELTYAAGSVPPGDRLRPFTNAMLRDRAELPSPALAGASRPNLAAWLAYDAGRTLLDAWNLGAAESRFREATRIDPTHAHAQLWLAQTLTWSDDASARGDRRRAAMRAVEHREQLQPRDREIATGLLALAESRFPEACAAFDAANTQERDFRALMGLGDCRARDPVVVPDQDSPSGFSFRGSLHSGVNAYIRGLETLHDLRPAFAYARVSAALRTQMNLQRTGYRVDGDTIRYGAYPILVDDTVGFVPYPAGELAGVMARVEPRIRARALDRNRTRLRDLFAQWVRMAPTDPHALAMFATLLETTGDIAPATAGETSALTATRTARALEPDSLRRLGLAADEVRLLLKNEQFAAAAELADSLLAVHASPDVAAAERLLGLATLTGRLDRATDLLRTLSASSPAPAWMEERPANVPPILIHRLASARTAAMVGLCPDSVQTLREWIDRSLASHYADSAERQRVRTALTWRPLSQAVPCLGVAVVQDLGTRDRLVALQNTLATRGSAALRAEFEQLQAARRDLRPGDVAVDYTYHEAWLLAQAGDTTGAITHLDRSLAALSTLGTYLEREPAQAAGLVRAMVLRASLAHAAADPITAAKWAAAVVALRDDADAVLQAEVNSMRGLAAVR